MIKRSGSVQRRYGIGEWYGRSFADLSPEKRKSLAKSLGSKARGASSRKCPFRSNFKCNKKGGVCTLRLYERDDQQRVVVPAHDDSGLLRTVCPNRFHEDERIFKWVGETVLNAPDPSMVGEVGFLESEIRVAGEHAKADDVGRIDCVLVLPDSKPLGWCALELQAVYFSGKGMDSDFKQLRAGKGTGIPFPTALRRPDYRSSGPKRLMPQLQIKVPTLRRWGKKMAVVVDRAFYNHMGQMALAKDISNSDIAWFVVKYEKSGDGFSLARDAVYYTTLEEAVGGLTGGSAVTQAEFESRILKKLSRSA